MNEDQPNNRQVVDIMTTTGTTVTNHHPASTTTTTTTTTTITTTTTAVNNPPPRRDPALFMAQTGSSLASSASASSSSNNNSNHNDSDRSLPPSDVMVASASAAAAAAAAAASSTAASLASISYLAPFVASVLRDQVMTDMNTEYEALKMKLKQQQEHRLRLELTGRNGDPVYCELSMKNGESGTRLDGYGLRSGIPYWDVIFEDYEDNGEFIIPNFIETVTGLELRLGGIVEFKFNGAKFYTVPPEKAEFDSTRENEPQMGLVHFNNDNSVRILGRLGPILYDDYTDLLGHSLPHYGMKVTELVRLLKDHQTNNNNDTVFLPYLQIVAVTFTKSQIKGILPLLEDTTTGELLSTSE